MGIAGNERADDIAKAGCLVGGPTTMTEGGMRALWKRLRAGQWSAVGYGAGWVSRWDPLAVSRYVQARTDKRELGVWRMRLGRGCVLCRLCQKGATETGDHLVCECMSTKGGMGWKWGRWIELDDKSKWAYEFEEGGKLGVGDRVDDFFA